MTHPTLRIASYNIRKTRGTDGMRRPGRILDVINSLEADVVVLQEADKRLGRRPAALPRAMIIGGSDFEVAEVAVNDVSLGWHGNAILVRKGLSVGAVRHINLPGFEPRGAVQVDIGGATPVRLIATHLGLRRKDRQAQLATLQLAVNGTKNAVIAGDFNEWSEEAGIAPLQASMTVHAPGKSFHARRPMAALDRIALAKGLTLHDGGVAQGMLARRSSDHLPIWVDVAPVGD